MATDFTDYETIITAEWLDKIAITVEDVLAAATTKEAARTALEIPTYYYSKADFYTYLDLVKVSALYKPTGGSPTVWVDTLGNFSSYGDLYFADIHASGDIRVGGVLYLDGETWNTISLQNSWVNFGGNTAIAAYKKLPDGSVACRGTIKSGTTTDGTLLFTLPNGYRPDEDKSIGVAGVPASGAVPNLYITASNGQVTVYGISANTYLSLEFVIHP